jgi:hypothetical protein
VIFLAVPFVLILFYFWLTGNWFARILTALALWPVFVVTIGESIASTVGVPAPSLPISALCLGIPAAVAWFAAGIPTYYHRHAARNRDADFRGMSLTLRD